jgi:hypothetical protein
MQPFFSSLAKFLPLLDVLALVKSDKIKIKEWSPPPAEAGGSLE